MDHATEWITTRKFLLIHPYTIFNQLPYHQFALRPRSNWANQEGKILLVLDDTKNGRIKSLRLASMVYEISYSTLHARANGRISRGDSRSNSHELIQLEGISLI